MGRGNAKKGGADERDTEASRRTIQERNGGKMWSPNSRGSVDYPSTRGIQVDVGLPDTTSENRVESPLDGE